MRPFISLINRQQATNISQRRNPMSFPNAPGGTPNQGGMPGPSNNGHAPMQTPFSPAGPDMGIDAVLKPLIDGTFEHPTPGAPGVPIRTQGQTVGTLPLP